MLTVLMPSFEGLTLARYVRVASISFGGTGKASTIQEVIDNNLREMTKLLVKAAADQPDITCFPECSPTLGLSHKESAEAAEEISGRILRTISALAKKHEMYVACPMVTKEDAKIYNSVVLIDRDGTVIGSYHKIHPTIGEIEGGITPGGDPKTFKLDFGAVGFAICFDLNFEDVMKGLARNGVELVLFPSMYPGGLQLKIWAFNYGVYVVSALTSEGSKIVDPLGRVLATSSTYSPVICKTINLDCEILHIDYNHMKWDSIKKRYGSKVELDVLRPEAVFMMTSNLQDVTVEDVVKEFKLETREEYFKRASMIREKALEGSK